MENTKEYLYIEKKCFSFKQKVFPNCKDRVYNTNEQKLSILSILSKCFYLQKFEKGEIFLLTYRSFFELTQQKRKKCDL